MQQNCKNQILWNLRKKSLKICEITKLFFFFTNGLWDSVLQLWDNFHLRFLKLYFNFSSGLNLSGFFWKTFSLLGANSNLYLGSYQLPCLIARRLWIKKGFFFFCHKVGYKDFWLVQAHVPWLRVNIN